MYADYTYYTGAYYGTKLKTEADYNRYGARASDFIDYCTMGKLTDNLPSASASIAKLKNACCRVADELYSIDVRTAELSDSGAVKSKSSGGESVTYELSELDSVITQGQQAIDHYLYLIVKVYLSGIADDSGYLYLYRGL